MTIYWPNISMYLVAAGLALGMGLTFAGYDYDVQGGLVVSFGLAVLGFFLIRKMAGAEKAAWFTGIIAAGLIIKFIATFVRLIISFTFYSGQDAERYHVAGSSIAEELRALDFSNIAAYTEFGTQFTSLYSGIVHAIVGPTLPGAFLVFGLFAFIGSFFFYRAFVIALPHGNRKLYAALVFLLPTMVYWPNGLGKDALVLFCLGIATYGAAHLFTGSLRKALLPLVIGLVGVLTIRPEITMVFLIPVAIGFMSGSKQVSKGSPVPYVIGLVLIMAAVGAFLPAALDKAKLDDLSPSSVQDRLGVYSGRESGGSAFKAPDVADPRQIPTVIATAVFRPFPWEANSLQLGLQTLEGVLLAGIVAWRIKSLGRSFLSVRNTPFILFVLLYVILLIPVIASLANYGLLVRQRTMLLPFFLMLLAVEAQPKDDKSESDAEPSRPAPMGSLS